MVLMWIVDTIMMQGSTGESICAHMQMKWLVGNAADSVPAALARMHYMVIVVRRRRLRHQRHQQQHNSSLYARKLLLEQQLWSNSTRSSCMHLCHVSLATTTQIAAATSVAAAAASAARLSVCNDCDAER